MVVLYLSVEHSIVSSGGLTLDMEMHLLLTEGSTLTRICRLLYNTRTFYFVGLQDSFRSMFVSLFR